MSISKELGDSRKYALELGQFFDSICRKYNIKYTLFGESLLGAVKWSGFANQSNTLSFALKYNEYNRFLEICKLHLEGREYYLANNETHPEIQENITLLVKRSRVVLPEGRKADELYYDFSIKIIPLFYAGNDIKTYRNHIKQCLEYLQVINSRKPVKGYTNITNFISKAKATRLASQDKKEAYKKLRNLCSCYLKDEKYVIIPQDEWKHGGCTIYSETYNEVKEIEVEGYKFLGICCAEQWLKDYYSKDLVEQMEKKQVNQMQLSGPEIARRIQLIELEMLVEVDRICRKYDIKYSLFCGTLLGAIRHKGFVPWDDDVDVVMLYPEYKHFLEVAKQELDPKKYFIKTQISDEDCNLVFAQIKRNDTLYYRTTREQYNTHLGVFIDIIPMHNGTNNWLMYKLQNYLCRFTKTMVWSHIGAASEKRIGYKTYYNLLSKVSNKTSYKWFQKFATMFKDDNSERVTYLMAIRNPFNGIFAKRKTYQDLIEVEFEGYMFYAPRAWKEYLTYLYSEDYTQLPKLEHRVAKHAAAHIDIGNLYEF